MTTEREELARILDDAGLGPRNIADALIPFIERAKAEALREMAASNDFVEGRGRVNRWLRDRADAIEKGTGR